MFKVSQYFQLKTCVLPALCLNIVYQFFGLCDLCLTYIDMSTHHLSIKVGEHLSFHLKTESSIKDHIMFSNICGNSKFTINSFKIIKKCNSNCETKIHKDLLCKKYNLGLNQHLFANRSSFSLNIF